MSDTTLLIIILVLASFGAVTWPLYRKFHENRAKEQKKPEKYHFT